MLALKNIKVQRGSKFVFLDFNTKIQNSSLTIISGKNGSGKSTLLRVIAGLTSLESGQITNNGCSIFINKEQWLQKLIFINVKNGLSNELTVIENLRSWVMIKGWVANKDDLIMALKSVEMDKYMDIPISQCSDGLKKRAALARLYFSFINPVEFWILDEPTNELDYLSFNLFQNLISKFVKIKGSILIATHDKQKFKIKYNSLNLDKMS